MSPVPLGLQLAIREWIESQPPTSIAQSWQPITDLPTDWKSLADPQLPSMIALWKERELELRDKRIISDFLDRLRRQWAIETGILERLYSLSDTATKVLIERGLDSALLTNSDTANEDPRHVMNMIQDQKDAIDALYALVVSNALISGFLIRQLHQTITRHQTYSEGTDPQGRVVRTPMSRGEWKSRPNRVERSDGSILEFCPPVQVESEIETLVRLHREHGTRGVPPEVEAAWLHHRFTIIHPFDDGNGRIARCLATLVMLQAGYFPLVVTRTDRVQYITSLRSADKGDLAPLVATISSLQRKAIREALDLSAETVRNQGQRSQMLAAIRRQLAAREKRVQNLQDQSLDVADALFHIACEHLKKTSEELTATLKSVNERYWAPFSKRSRGGLESNYNTMQTIEAAREYGYFANIDAYHAWAKIDMRAAGRWEILVTVHGSGRAKGFFAASAMLYQRLRRGKQSTTEIDRIELLSPEPFEFTYRDDAMDVRRRFEEWITAAVELGLDLWRSRIE